MSVFVVTVGAAMTSSVLVACSSDRAGQADAATPDEVTYLTGFGATGREGFAFLAKAKGYFADNNIDVTIQAGAAGNSNLQLLAAGRAQFAVIDYGGAVIRAGNGQFDQYKIVAALNANTLIAIMAKAGTGIRNPRDLAGKTVAVGTGSVPKTLFPGYARLAGLDHRTVTFREVAPPQLPSLLSAGTVDAIGQFVPGRPAVAKAVAPADVVVLPYSDYFSDLYGNVLVVSADLLARNRDLVRRFTAALLRGLTYSVSNDATATETGQITHSQVPATDATVATAEVKELRNWVGVGPAGEPVGGLNPTRVARGVAAMRGLGLTQTSPDPTTFVDFNISPSPTATPLSGSPS